MCFLLHYKSGDIHMTSKTLKTAYATNPKLKDYLIIVTEETKTFLIPEKEFTNLIIKAGERFNIITPLGPYPSIFGVEWKTNKTIYEWFVKQLIEIQKRYNWVLETYQ